MRFLPAVLSLKVWAPDALTVLGDGTSVRRQGPGGEVRPAGLSLGEVACDCPPLFLAFWSYVWWGEETPTITSHSRPRIKAVTSSKHELNQLKSRAQITPPLAVSVSVSVPTIPKSTLTGGRMRERKLKKTFHWQKLGGSWNSNVYHSS